MADNTDDDGGPNSSSSETMSTANREWIPQDLDLLRSGLYADAEIICKGNISRKVHRSILASRSTWFKQAFSDADKEHGDCKIRIEEGFRNVDLMLYFFYVGEIDVTDKALTAHYGFLEISIELIRLGNTLQEKRLQDYGKSLLASYLHELLNHMCYTRSSKKSRFEKLEGSPYEFYGAVHLAFSTKRPVKAAQLALADFVFAARNQLFTNPEFIFFILDGQVPQFGNLVLASLMTGNVSDAFKGDFIFENVNDWRWTPPSLSFGCDPSENEDETVTSP